MCLVLVAIKNRIFKIGQITTKENLEPATPLYKTALDMTSSRQSEAATSRFEGDDNVGAPKEKLNLFKLMIHAVFDMAETSLKNVTLSMISTSVT